MERTRWYKDKVFYQIWPRSFKDGDGDGVGDLYGVLEKLDYIKSLGCDGIWFSPLYPSPNADMGYDISDYMDISREYGGMDTFKKVDRQNLTVLSPTTGTPTLRARHGPGMRPVGNTISICSPSSSRI